MKKEMFEISKLKVNPKNPRIIKDEKFKRLCKSIQDFPEMMPLRPIIYDENKIILGGNMRFKALQHLGMKEVPADWVKSANELNEEQKKEFVIKDNNSFGEYDYDLLANEWDDLPLEEWGIDLPEIDIEQEAREDDYVMPDKIETDIVLGDIIEIGQHRLMCGDSTDSDQVAKLMNGEKADISFTSPPYNAGTTPTEIKMRKVSKYANDTDNKSSDEYLTLLVDFTNNTLLFSQFSFVNVQSLSGNKTALIEFLYNMKSVYAETIIWQKQTAQPAMAENVLNSQFEYVHVFSEKANRAIGTKKFRGTLSNVIQISKQNNNEVKTHNATFPIAFAAYFVENFASQSVLDLFLGSGTTMVAAHQLNRKCYGMEIDPQYCQVIVDRMKQLDASLGVKINGKVIS